MSWIESFIKFNTLNGSEFFTYLILCTSLTLAVIYLFRRQQKAWLIDKLPGPKAYPILGNALEVNVEPKELFKVLTGKMCDYESSVSRFWIGLKPCCVIYRCVSTEVILSSQKHIDKSSDYTFLHPWLGTGLLTSTGKKWQSRRKMLTPTFHFKILQDFMDIFNRQSSVFVKNLDAYSDGKPFDIFRFVTLCTLDIILETAMGTSINAQNNADSEYVQAVYKIGAIIQKRGVRPWLHPDILFNLFGYGKEFNSCIKILHGFSNKTIAERKKQYNEIKRLKEDKNKTKAEDEELNALGKKMRLAFLDLLLESSENNALTDEDIREEVDTFIFEGHDTTASAINWSLYLLGAHPEIQAKVIEEMNTIFENSDRPATIDDLREMKLLECCIKEALRLFPSVPFIARELREDAFIDGYTIPAGTTTMIVTYSLHRDPVQFPDPELFKPERFLPENSSKRHPYAYVPFSAGPRNCIGQRFALMEEKVVLSTFFRKYRVESTVRREDLKILGELILRPEDGNVVKIFPQK